jgi:Ca-activated chloride channel homolog
MNRRIVMAALSALTPILFLPLIQAQVPVRPSSFRANAQLVLVPVTVMDHSGKTLLGLDSSHFTVLDDQKPQQIVSFSIDDAPCSVGLIMDISGSMRQTTGAMKEVGHAFLSASNPQDEFLLLTVSTEPQAVSSFTTDVAALERSIESAKTGGATALIDTVYLGLESMRRGKQPRRALLVFSDGMDNHSRYSKTELMRMALEVDVQIYTIMVEHPGTDAVLPFRPAMIRKPGDQTEETQGRTLLEELADKSGGLHFRVMTAEEAKEAAAKVGQAIRDEYVIGYQASDAAEAGKWHRIRVKSDVPHSSVYARNGYYAR